MRRRLFNILAAVSLVMFLVTAMLWARSHWRRYDMFLFVPDGRCFVTAFYRGGCYGWTEEAISNQWQGLYASRPPDAHPALDNPQFYLAGFGFTHEAHPRNTWNFYLCRVPMWLLTAVFAGACLFNLRKGVRVREGFCRHCGYNLTGNVSGVCPECGTAIPAKAEVV